MLNLIFALIVSSGLQLTIEITPEQYNSLYSRFQAHCETYPDQSTNAAADAWHAVCEVGGGR